MRKIFSTPRKKKVSGDDAVISACIFKKKPLLKASSHGAFFVCVCDVENGLCGFK